MYRIPLWPTATMDSHSLGGWRATSIPVVDIHELAAGKVAALLARRRAIDLFDSRLILSMRGLSRAMLRTAFVVYGAMDRRDWRTVSVDDVAFDSAELSSQLVPALRTGRVPDLEAVGYGESLVDECREALVILLPFNDAERAFLNLLLDEGIIDATLLTCDEMLQEQPSSAWPRMEGPERSALQGDVLMVFKERRAGQGKGWLEGESIMPFSEPHFWHQSHAWLTLDDGSPSRGLVSLGWNAGTIHLQYVGLPELSKPALDAISTAMREFNMAGSS